MGGRKIIKIFQYSAIAVVGFFIVIIFGANVARAETNIYALTDITSDTTWTLEGSPYVIDGWAWLDVKAILTIESGVVIKFRPDYWNQRFNGINVSEGGKIIANGTEENPIIFTSYYDDENGGDTNNDGSNSLPVAGDWRGIIFDADESVLDHVKILYSANTRVSYGAIEAKNGSSASFVNSVIQYCAGSCVRLNEPNNASFSNITISDSADFGIYSTVAGSSVLFSNSTIQNCADGIAQLSAGNTLAFSNVSFLYNKNAVEIIGSSIENSATWPKIGDSVYILRRAIEIFPDASLTIDPEVVIKSNYGNYPNTRLEIKGKLIAKGTQDNPIVFTSLSDNPSAGDWGGLYFEDSSGSELAYVEIKYGGRFFDDFSGIMYATTNYNMIHLKDSSVSVATSTIASASTVGIYLEGASSLVMADSVIGTTTTGIFSLSSSNSAVSNSSFTNNSLYAINNLGALIDARNNWWGDNSGPDHEDNPEGIGQKISRDVLFDPWTDYDHTDQYSNNIAPALSFIGDSGYESDGIEPNISFVNDDAPIFKIAFSDADFDDAQFVRLIVGDNSYAMATTASSTFSFIPTVGAFSNGAYTYHFEASDGQSAVRLPTSGELFFEVQFAPVILVPGILGSWKVLNRWEIDPILNTYDNLWEAFQDAGYVVDQTLFAFPYNWRLSNIYTAELLKDKIDEVKQICNCNKVDIVAHSMGGLVARAYVELLDYENDIDQLIFLGTPHKGSTRSYFTWEAGEIGPDRRDKIRKNILLLDAIKSGYLDILSYVRGMPLESVKELLPIYNYLNKGDIDLEYPDNYPKNTFLDLLNNESKLSALNNLEEMVNIRAETGESNTILSLKVVDYTGDDNKWEHGYPENFDVIPFTGDGIVYGSGDLTVPAISNESFFGLEDVVISSNHSDMVTDAQKIVIKELTGIEPNEDVRKNIFTKWLMVRIFSPADFQVIAPDGSIIGKDFENNIAINQIEGAFYSGFDTDIEFAVIPDPIEGEYEVILKGTSEGEYTLITDYITDTEEITQQATGQVQENQQIQYNLAYASDGAENIVIAPEDTEPPATSISIIGANMGENRYQESAVITLPSIDNSSGVQRIEYSVDNGASWQTYVSAITLSEIGDTEFMYRAIDNVGNTESAKTILISIKQKQSQGVITVYSNNSNQGEVLGEQITQKIDYYTDDDILSALSNANLDVLLDYLGVERDIDLENSIQDKFIEFSSDNNSIIFIAYGTKGTEHLGAGERAGVLYSYKRAFGKLPQTPDDWMDVLNISNHDIPNQRNAIAEQNAKNAFKLIFGRDPILEHPSDNYAIMEIAYGLRPQDRDLEKEKIGIKKFIKIYKALPDSSFNWDVVRCLSYSKIN